MLPTVQIGYRSMRSVAATAFALALCGCAGNYPASNIYPCCIGQSVVGNAAYVTVANVYNEMEALPLAQKHCAEHGRMARFSRMQGPRAVFDCVK
jgi:hypothetical protein